MRHHHEGDDVEIEGWDGCAMMTCDVTMLFQQATGPGILREATTVDGDARRGRAGRGEIRWRGDAGSDIGEATWAVAERRDSGHGGRWETMGHAKRDKGRHDRRWDVSRRMSQWRDSWVRA